MSSRFATTPTPPYYAVIFTSQHTDVDAGYAETAERMLRLAAEQPGYLGVETTCDPSGLGITVSYWESLEAVAGWRRHLEHREAQARGRREWYSHFELRVAKVERAHAGP
ncbi:MAG TPA: antibiotic biosynthesis monooxygenase [Nevskiaceae bacterium]|nr:antibiotic biosynthesis monooxygenase [Nevskiaceae bacterium]